MDNSSPLFAIQSQKARWNWKLTFAVRHYLVKPNQNAEFISKHLYMEVLVFGERKKEKENTHTRLSGSNVLLFSTTDGLY